MTQAIQVKNIYHLSPDGRLVGVAVLCCCSTEALQLLVCAARCRLLQCPCVCALLHIFVGCMPSWQLSVHEWLSLLKGSGRGCLLSCVYVPACSLHHTVHLIRSYKT